MVVFIAGVAATALLIFLAIGADWTRDALENFMLIRLLFLGVGIVVASLVALRSLDKQTADDRPAPWLLYAMIIAAGGMLIHNLIDFSLFEVGPMLLFAVVVGSALGLRQKPSRAEPGKSVAAGAALLAGVMLWIGALVLLWVPAVQAQRAIDEAEICIRTKQIPVAEAQFMAANRAIYGWNADFAYRAAIISPPKRVQEHLAEAIRQNPMEPMYYVTLARAELRNSPPDGDVVRRGYDAALRINPNDVRMHLEYARALAGFGDTPGAYAHFQEAKRYNQLLNSDEAKRLRPDELEQIEAEIKKLP